MSKIFSHILIIPYPYYNREYLIGDTQNIILNSSLDYFDIEKEWKYIINGVAFYRFADRGYDLLTNNKILAAAFHGRGEFELSDLSPNSKILSIKNDEKYYKNIINKNEYIKYEGIVKPLYQLKECGVTIAFDLFKKISRDIFCLIQLRLPIVNRFIYHNRGWSDIIYNQNCFFDDRLYLDSLNKYFKVRVDYLLENEVISPVRNIADLKKINGVIFIKDSSENYFLEKQFIKKDISEDIIDFDNNEYEDNQLNRNYFNSIENFYAITEFDDMALPTIEAISFYEKLLEKKSKYSNNLLYSITRGEYLGKNYNWNSVRMSYIAPLDIQYNISKIFNKYRTIISALFSFVIPIKNNLNLSDDNYILRSFFKDQYALRFGSQLTYDINKYYQILFYGSWQYYIPANQIIPAIFENISAYGLSPLYLNGMVSWYETYLATHLVIKYNDYFGINLGYQYIYKSGDKIIPECENFYLINGEKYKLDYSSWQDFSTSIANLLSFNMYFYYDYLQFDFGLRGLFAGKNVIKINECALKIGINF